MHCAERHYKRIEHLTKMRRKERREGERVSGLKKRVEDEMVSVECGCGCGCGCGIGK